MNDFKKLNQDKLDIIFIEKIANSAKYFMVKLDYQHNSLCCNYST